MFKAFKAKIHGAASTSQGDQTPIDTILTFTKYKIRLRDEQVNRIYFDRLLVQLVTDKMEYDFDKRQNKDDKKMFSIILKQKLNALDTGLHHLDISQWNKIKANIIHNRYWIDKEKDWFFKTIIAVLFGALITFFVTKTSYKQGYNDGLKEGKKQSISNSNTNVKPN